MCYLLFLSYGVRFGAHLKGSVLTTLVHSCLHTTEEMLVDDGIRLLAARKANSKRPHEPWMEYLISISRKRIEIAFCDIAKYMPKTIHAVTQNRFIIRIHIRQVNIFVYLCTITIKNWYC
jgi:hypothetical protein